MSVNRETAAARGMYDASEVRDACGVGFVCRMDGRPTHGIVAQAIQLLERLEHRGACGCDQETGDGAGVSIQIPHEHVRSCAADLEIPIPAPGEYAVGVVFLPRNESVHAERMEAVEEAVGAEGQRLLGWRRVPTRSESVGEIARAREPECWHLYIGRGDDVPDRLAFERRLYVIRKRIEKKLAIPGDAFGGAYVASMSSRTLVYKGMLKPDQLTRYYPDLRDPLLKSAVAMVHSRFSTNTLPRWPLAQPFRYLAHNGEINTLKGNLNWMRAREARFSTDLFDEDPDRLRPVLTPGGSDSQNLDNALELLCLTGRSLPHAVMMLIPEAWQHADGMSDEKRAFYEYHSCIMEPWDGPAAVTFTDGRYVGAVLDRNGLRPARYAITQDGLVVMASEAGVLDVPPEEIVEKGRLAPGRMFLVDLDEGRVIDDAELKSSIACRRPYRTWVQQQMVCLNDLEPDPAPPSTTGHDLHRRQASCGYTLEEIRLLIRPMVSTGKEALGSMGADTPLAVLSDKPRLLYDYFKQLFAQVTNPPLDAIRERLVTSMSVCLGREGDLFSERAQHAHRLRIDSPVLTPAQLETIRSHGDDRLRVSTLRCLYPVEGGADGLEDAIERLCRAAEEAIDRGASILVLSDRDADGTFAAIPALLAVSAVHHYLIRGGRRTGASLVVESAEPREVHHLCLLIGFGAAAVCPYLLFDTVREEIGRGRIEGTGFEEAERRVAKALDEGILKVMSKMGISTIQSYCGAQIFEAVGLDDDVVGQYFTGTPSRLGGIGLDVIAEEVRMRHEQGYPREPVGTSVELDPGGLYQWRRNGERHLCGPMTIAKLQHSVRQGGLSDYEEYSRRVNDQADHPFTIRGLLEFRFEDVRSECLEDVESWTEIAKRFKTGAMSFGSISKEAHEALAIAMNRIGGRSNTGEGGEAPERYAPDHPARSRIKQIASGRFGVTIEYLASADEIQIKMAQGAKPGEGGQLPGSKVYPWIARTRHSTPYVGLISPPPHHDIYSIEDLAQLIFDLKNANPQARISVKLVSEAGVGTIAAGVAKAGADVILISGYDGGTGASPLTSIVHAGLPWELGLAEAHQALVANGLRNRVRLECDGQLKTGRDVAMAAVLGADEFGFATAPLVALGCIMTRKCHLNTCPVGIATQDPELRQKFSGQPEHVINFVHFVAEELRSIMARLGCRTLDELTGRVDLVSQRKDVAHWKAGWLDLTPILTAPRTPEMMMRHASGPVRTGVGDVLDRRLLQAAGESIESGSPVEIVTGITNRDRATGTLLSHEICRRRGPDRLPEDTIRVNAVGSAGQSCGAFLCRGVTLRVEGEANDYLGKGLSGGRLVLVPPSDAQFVPNMNIIAGNVALYGATSGSLFVRGRAGERFAVRNSGAMAVVEGVGDHGCEYMTGGRVVVLGPTGRNFAAGMSGGVAYVMDGTQEFRNGRCNMESVELFEMDPGDNAGELFALVEQHRRLTGSDVASWVIDNWDEAVRHFVRVMPVEYRLALQRLDREREVRSGRRPVVAL